MSNIVDFNIKKIDSLLCRIAQLKATIVAHENDLKKAQETIRKAELRLQNLKGKPTLSIVKTPKLD